MHMPGFDTEPKQQQQSFEPSSPPTLCHHSYHRRSCRIKKGVTRPLKMPGTCTHCAISTNSLLPPRCVSSSDGLFPEVRNCDHHHRVSTRYRNNQGSVDQNLPWKFEQRLLGWDRFLRWSIQLGSHRRRIPKCCLSILRWQPIPQR
jgi:hypothetical protein